jgi:uncharacterized protein (TIGR00290 family)
MHYQQTNIEMNNSEPKILISWSGGKDSALALYRLIKTQKYHVQALVTTVTRDFSRISMHGVRIELLMKQAESLGLPVEQINIDKDATDRQYEQMFLRVLRKYREQGVSHVAFGDIFLEDVKQYRETRLLPVHVVPVFPLWKMNSAELASSFINAGFKAIVTCVDSFAMDGMFAGRLYDREFLSELPEGVDP